MQQGFVFVEVYMFITIHQCTFLSSISRGLYMITLHSTLYTLHVISIQLHIIKHGTL